MNKRDQEENMMTPFEVEEDNEDDPFEGEINGKMEGN